MKVGSVNDDYRAYKSTSLFDRAQSAVITRFALLINHTEFSFRCYQQLVGKMKWYFVLAILIGIQLAESEITFQELEVEVKNILRGEEELRSKAFPKEMQDIFKMTEFTKLNNELKQIALEELAYFEENGIDIRKLHRFVNNREGYKTTKDILVDYSAVLLIFASIPYVASLETSFFNSLKRSTVHGILKINEKDLKWCENQEHGTTFYRLSYTTNQKSPPDCTGMAYHPFDASHTFNQLFHSLLLKADDFKEGESRPSYPWLKTMYDQMSIKYPSLDHKVMPELLMEMFKESCEQGISHHRYKVVAGSYGMPLVYNRGTEQSTNLLDVFNHTLTQFNEWSGEEGTKLRSKCGPRFTADIVWVVYSGILWKKCPEILQKFNNEVIQAKNKGLGHLIAAMDVVCIISIRLF